MNKENKDIGELFRNAFEKYEAKPDKSVWSAVKSQIQPGFTFFGKKIPYKAAIFTLTSIALVVSLVVVFTYENEKEVNIPTVKTKVMQQITNTKKVQNSLLNDEASTQKLTKNSTKQLDIVTPISFVEINKESSTSAITSNTNENSSSENTNFKSIEPNNNQPIEEPKVEVTANLIPIANNDELKPNSVSKNKFSVCFGEECILQGELGNLTYKWSTGEISRNIKIIAQQSDSYYLTFTDQNGKSKTEAYEIEVDNECTTVFLPSAFSPNNDGNNDIYKGEGVGIVKYNLTIVDKSGKIVFESNNINQGWDGKIAGAPANPTFYFYFASYTDAKNQIHTKRGQLTLIR